MASEIVPLPDPSADPSCSKCNGKGKYIDPPREQQEREAEQGKRKYLQWKLCSCLKVS